MDVALNNWYSDSCFKGVMEKMLLSWAEMAQRWRQVMEVKAKC